MKNIKLVIVGTTIQGEAGYLPFDELASVSRFSDVTFVIAGDKGGKLFDTSKFKCKVEYMKPEDQERFRVSSVIPWKDPRRRPLAWLRALELYPDFILSVDDDNIPDSNYFEKWYQKLTTICDAVVALSVANNQASPLAWHNYLRTSDSPIPLYPRGYPVALRTFRANPRDAGRTHVVSVEKMIEPEEIGLFQGISFGDPDIDALPRIAFEGHLTISSVEKANYCLRGIWSPYNMQNTVFSRRLFPLPMLWPFAGRYDDIYASFAWQQLLFNNGMYVHVGEPFNSQDRGMRDIFKGDLRLEVSGYLHAHEVAQEISTITERDATKFLEALMNLPHPEIQMERPFFEAYLADVSEALQPKNQTVR